MFISFWHPDFDKPPTISYTLYIKDLQQPGKAPLCRWSFPFDLRGDMINFLVFGPCGLYKTLFPCPGVVYQAETMPLAANTAPGACLGTH